MKEHKTQILAALALAFMLGAVVPSATFASDGTEESGEAGIEAQANDAEGANAEGDGTGSEEKTLGLSESIVELNKRIQTRAPFNDYWKAANRNLTQNLIYNMQNLAVFTVGAEAGMMTAGSGLDDKETLWTDLSADTKAAIKDMTYYGGLNYIKTQNGADYNKLKVKVDEKLALANNAISTIRSIVSANYSGVTLAANLAPEALITAVKDGVKDYAKFEALYNALDFIRVITPSAGDVTVDNVEAKYDEAKQMVYYNKLALAALEIDGSVLSGLHTYKLPTTSANPEAPNTGIIGLIESGALDLGTITLIVSVAVASIAGLGLIAKLYLKHKF